MLREVCFLIGHEGDVIWSDASDDPSALPDSRTRWEAIWNNRDRLAEIAHSHPKGPRAFSSEDESTMRALCDALGNENLRFSVVAPDGMIRREHHKDTNVQAEPWWAALLRLASGLS